MKTYLRLAIFSACCLSSLAFAQWQWLDKDGRPVFSDRAPPPNIPEKSVLQRPGRTPALSDANSAISPDKQVAAPAQTAVSAPSASGIDKDLAEKKKKAQAEENAKRKAETDRMNTAKADNCKRARASKAGLDSGVRIARTNLKGEREFLDDAARAVESKRVQTIIDTDCKPLDRQ